MALQRIAVHRSPQYKANGLKSYAFAMTRYGFHPTKEGPYYQGKVFHDQGKFGGKVGGRMRTQHVLRRRHHHHPHHAGGSAPPAGSAPASTPPASSTPAPSDPSSDPTPAAGSTPASGSTEDGTVPAEDIQNDSLYLCQVGIGTPAQNLYLDFDTGSSDLWVWSTELPQSTLSQANPQNQQVPFDASKSSTFKSLSGSTWNISYGDGSSASGDVGTDLVNLGGLEIQNQAVELAKQLSSSFASGNGSGLLGLAFSKLNTVSPTPQETPVDNLISQKEITQQLFTAYLGSWRDAAEADKGESFYTFGFIDTAISGADAPNYATVDNSQGFWQIQSTTATINGTTVNRPSGNTAIMDTGTTLCLVDDTLVEAVYKAIPGSKYDSTQQGYLFPANTSVDQLPQVNLAIGDGSTLVQFQKEDLGFADAGNGMVYGSIQSRGSMDMDIYGDAVLKAIYAIFDMNNGSPRFGWVQRTEATQNTAVPPTQSGQ